MLKNVLYFMFALSTFPLPAQEMAYDCAGLYAEIAAQHPMNLEGCIPVLESKVLDQCTLPSKVLAEVPTSHLILAIDASGSMAGRVGGDTKMKIAKREAVAFLSELPDEIKVALVVYGHRGSNQESGKTESCASSEMVHAFDDNRRALVDSIQNLSPTGYTPLGGVLEYSATLIADLDPPRDGELGPTIYLLSDGEETCEGDPVGAASVLFKAGVQTTVNTIGFDVDAETSAQLEAIADAAGGIYYPAETASSLRSQLAAIADAESQRARYEYCVLLNEGKIALPFLNANQDLASCYGDNDPQDRQLAILRAMKAAEKSGAPEAVCKDTLSDMFRKDKQPYRGWIREQTRGLSDEREQLLNAYRDEMRLDVTGQ